MTQGVPARIVFVPIYESLSYQNALGWTIETGAMRTLYS